MMTLTELKYLVALAQTCHFGKAAAKCHVTQPTLSVAINKLESKLGVSIFERYPGRLRVTEIGEKIIQQTKRALDEVARIGTISQSGKAQLNTPLKLGGIYTVAPYLFPILIPKLKKRAQNMPLLIKEDFTANLKQQLQQGSLDAIFVSLPFSATDVVVKPIFDEPFMVLMRKDHALAKKNKIAPTDLKAENIMLLGEGHCLRDQVLAACPGCHEDEATQAIVEGASLETFRHMVASGLGLTILPLCATQVSHYKSTLCAKYLTKNPKRTIVLAWRASFPRTQAIQVLIEALADCKFAV